MRKRSGQNFQEIVTLRDLHGLSRLQSADIISAFKKTQQKPGAGLSFYDLIQILRMYCGGIDEIKKASINQELITKEIRTIDLNTTLMYAAALKKERQEQKYDMEDAQNNEYIDAFVALGGNSDSSGCVSKTHLINILKQEFELNFDIEGLLSSLDTSSDENIFFPQFRKLFDQEQPSARSSALSILSSRTIEQPRTMKTLVIQEQQFQKYLSRLQATHN